MPKPRFRPFSSEKRIEKTNCTIQIGDISGRWAVVLRKILENGKKKAIALKRIQKLTDTQIVEVIKDTIGKDYDLDTFTLGSTMSALLREVYAKIKDQKSKSQKPKAQKPASQPAPTMEKKTSPSLALPSVPKKRRADSFWSSYDSAPSQISEQPEISNQPTQTTQPAQPSQPIQPTQPSQPQERKRPPTSPTNAPTIPNQTITQEPAKPIEDESSELDDILGDLGLSCPFCGKEIDPEDENCPYCGKKIPL
ncbi:MAG: hypothetical protein GF329_19425 [Candidatus Lokiarchaeota archaeon]|nr:hypothetical protein [Candidatus Lokiarchaeota archaeon]